MADVLGLGFMFNATVGRAMKSSFRVVNDGISTIGEGMQLISKIAGENPLATMFSAATFGALNDLKRSLGEIVDIQGSMGNLTSRLENFSVQVDESFQQAAAGLDLSADAMQRWQRTVESAAITTNTDIGTSVAAFKALVQQNIELGDIGVESFEDWLRIIKVTNMDVQGFTSTLGLLRSEYGFTGDAVTSILDDFAELSRRGNLGADSIGSMTSQLETLRPLLVVALERDGPRAVATMLRSTQALAGVMQQALGGDVQQNMSASIALTESLARAQYDWQNAFAGIGEIPDFMTTLGQAFGSMQVSQDLVGLSSVDFIKRIRELYAVLQQRDPQQAAVFMRQLSVALGENVSPAVASLFTDTRDLNSMFDAMGDPSGPIAGAEGAFNRLTDSFRDGRDLSDHLTLGFEILNQRFRNLGDRDEIQKLITGKLLPAMRDMGDWMDEAVAKDGPMGRLIKTMSQFEQIGLAAFLPITEDMGVEIFKWGQMVGWAYTKFEPFVHGVVQGITTISVALTGMGAVVNTAVHSGTFLLNVWQGTSVSGVIAAGVIASLSAAVVGLAGAYALGTETGGKFAEWLKGWAGRLDDMGAQLINWLSDGIDGFVQWLETPAAVRGMTDGIVSTVNRGVERAAEVLQQVDSIGPALQRLGGSIVSAGSVIGSMLWDEIVKTWNSYVTTENFLAITDKVLDWSLIGTEWLVRGIVALDNMANSLIAWLGGEMPAHSDAMGEALAGVDWDRVSEVFMRLAASGWKLGEIMVKIAWASLKAAGGELYKVIMGYFKRDWQRFLNDIDSIMSGLGTRIWDGLTTAFGDAWGKLKDWFGGVSAWFRTAFDGIVDAMKQPMNTVLTWVGQTIEWLRNKVTDIINGLLRLGGRITAYASSFAESLGLDSAADALSSVVPPPITPQPASQAIAAANATQAQGASANAALTSGLSTLHSDLRELIELQRRMLNKSSNSAQPRLNTTPSFGGT